MPKLSIDFSDVPDTIPVVPPGEYEFEVVGTPELLPTKKDPSKDMIKLVLRIINHAEFSGRQVYDYIMCSRETDIKRLALSCGLDLSDGLETEALTGQTGRVLLMADEYQGKPTTKVKDYLF